MSATGLSPAQAAQLCEPVGLAALEGDHPRSDLDHAQFVRVRHAGDDLRSMFAGSGWVWTNGASSAAVSSFVIHPAASAYRRAGLMVSSRMADRGMRAGHDAASQSRWQGRCSGRRRLIGELFWAGGYPAALRRRTHPCAPPWRPCGQLPAQAGELLEPVGEGLNCSKCRPFYRKHSRSFRHPSLKGCPRHRQCSKCLILRSNVNAEIVVPS
jgi:hypothetical protein